GLDDLFYESEIARAAGERERRFAVLVRRVDLRAGGQQHFGGFLIVEVDRPRERRRAVGLRDVDVGARLDEGFEGFVIATFDRVQQIGSVVGQADRGGDNERCAALR